jgi:hypothetical protein
MTVRSRSDRPVPAAGHQVRLLVFPDLWEPDPHELASRDGMRPAEESPFWCEEEAPGPLVSPLRRGLA